MQEIEDYHFRGIYDFKLRVRYNDGKYTFRYLNIWHPIEEHTLKKMCEQSNLKEKIVDRMKLKIVS